MTVAFTQGTKSETPFSLEREVRGGGMSVWSLDSPFASSPEGSRNGEWSDISWGSVHKRFEKSRWTPRPPQNEKESAMRPGGVARILGYADQDHKGEITKSVPSVEAFQKNLLRERYRADRNGLVFCVLTISMKYLKDWHISESTLIRFVMARVRFTDYVGWFDDENLGVILPDTPESGAWKLAEDICAQVSATIPRLICKVYSYPSQNSQTHDQQHSTGGERSDRSKGMEPGLGVSHASAVAVEGSGESAACKTRETVAPADNGWSVHPFFARPIPTWKRALDIVGSLLALLLLAPVFAIIAIVIKMVSQGPVFFRQERIGYLGKPFMFWKFRTMAVDNSAARHKEHMSSLIHNDIPMNKLDSKHDPRIIPFGIFLRKSCLDELPQLINVLWGDMSLVGPRPCLPYEAQQYLLWHARRFDSVPGMTGLWQVSGKNRTTFREMIRLDINYERQRSFWLDLKILLKTIPAIVRMATESMMPSKGTLNEGLDGKTA
jgi:lipopolysaccharide/colanic/teichoic acid biosynthesis glycosyltransferase